MRKKIFFFFWLSFATGFVAGADPVNLEEAVSVLLVDSQSDQILMEKNIDQVIAPASLTKLMTLHLAWQMLDNKIIEKNQLVPITEEVSARAMPAGSSLMFLEKGQRVSVFELMQGLAVASGNDAAMALGTFLGGGNLENFIALMNQEALLMGLPNMFFVEPSGINEKNQITARSFMRFCSTYVKLHPQALNELHSLTQMSYPLAKNLPPSGALLYPYPIMQKNKNNLLSEYPFSDGLKTGFIDEAGYHLAATAQKKERRLFLVILGIQAENGWEGSRKRTAMAKELFEYGFNHFVNVALNDPLPEKIRVWEGSQKFVSLRVPDRPVYATIPSSAKRPTLYIHLEPFPVSPIQKTTQLGTIHVYSGEDLLKSYTLYPEDEVPRGSWVRRGTDAVSLFFLKNLANRKK